MKLSSVDFELERGVALSSVGPALLGQVFVCRRGKRHYVRDVAALAAAGFSWSEIQPVSSDILRAYLPGSFAPHFWSLSNRNAPFIGATSYDMREITASYLTGTGLEIGALGSPFPVPLDCDVIYADVYSYAELIAIYGDELRDTLVRPQIRTNFATLNGVAEASFDFIVASHVIEHTTDPVGAIIRAGKKLRPGGYVLLVVPDITRTFDRYRPLTTLDHLLLDYYSPDRRRDLGHYREFYELAYTPEMPHAATWEKSFERNESIHFHTWSYSSFMEMVEKICFLDKSLALHWSHPTLESTDNFEFYVLVRKI
jgi:SAM-dependent methyltransferase